MENNIERNINRLAKKDRVSLQKEISDREKAYRQEINLAGFDNTHDYENMVAAGLGKRIFIVALLLLLLIGFCIIL